MKTALDKVLNEMNSVGDRIDELDFLHQWTPAQAKEHDELSARYEELDLHRRAIGRPTVHPDEAVDPKEQ